MGVLRVYRKRAKFQNSKGQKIYKYILLASELRIFLPLVTAFIRMLLLDILKMFHDGNFPSEFFEVFFRHFFGADEGEFSLCDVTIDHDIDEVAATDENGNDTKEEIEF